MISVFYNNCLCYIFLLKNICVLHELIVCATIPSSLGTIVSSALPGERPTPTSQFDATSILATANKLLGLAEEGVAPLTDRMKWANTFAGEF